VPKDKAKILTVDEIFRTFYEPNSEKLDEIKSNEKRLALFIRAFVKTANKYAKQNGINIRVGGFRQSKCQNPEN